MGAKGSGTRLRRPPCSVNDCARESWAKGLCLMHYKRQRRSEGALTPVPEVGSPSGHGQWGVLDDDGETVLCHECGERLRRLGWHVGRTHGITVRDYKLKHGLPLSRGLLPAQDRERAAEASRSKVGSAAWARLEEARDPTAASHARDEHAMRSTWAAAERAHRATELGRASRRTVVRSCPICAAQWCPLPGGYHLKTCSPECWRAWQAVLSTQAETPNARRDDEIRAAHRAGATYADLARQHGLTPERIGQIIRRSGR